MNGQLSFDYPFMLAAFTVFIPMIIFDVINRKRKNDQTGNSRLPLKLSGKIKISVFFFRLFVFLSIIAAAGPRWGTGFSAAEYRRGLDAVFAIDVSRSMDIRDVQENRQSRLERGLLIAGDAVTRVTGARFAAAIGRRNGYLTVPLTWDNEAVLSFIETLDGSSMTGRSTNLEALLDASITAFPGSSAAHKLIVLISDGESHEGVIANAIGRCVREGIIINAVAIGSDAGRPVLAEEDVNENETGQVPISRRNTAVMRNAAERTGGIYIDGNRNDASSNLAANMLSVSQETGFRNIRKESKERRTLFIILAIISYGLSKFLAKSLPGKRSPGTLFTMIFIIFYFTSCNAESKLLLLEANYLSSRGRYNEALVPYIKALDYEDAAPYAEFGMGHTFYLLDEGKAALNRYSNSRKFLDAFPAEEHKELWYRIHYNSGIIYFEEEDYLSAARAFKDALRADPKRAEAKHNLELSLMSIVQENERNNQNDEPQANEAKEIIFEYLKQNEMQQWKSRDWSPEENFSGIDY